MDVFQLNFPLEEKKYQPSVIAIGYFDGVHLGHQKVINKACELAKTMNLPCGVMTFNPHPLEVIKGQEIDQITPLHSKLKILENEMGIDITYVVNFSEAFAHISPNDFIEFLRALNVKGVVVGFDFTYGYRGKGTPEILQQASNDQLHVEIVPPHNDFAGKISSTRIRDYLLSGNVTEVSRLLGRNYTIHGHVVHGDKRGRTIGFPTANLELIDQYFLIKKGVYAVKVHLLGETYIGVMNIGYKPTFIEIHEPTYEVYIIDFKKDIYNESMTVECIKFLRDEQKFNHLEDLKTQIKMDVEKTKELLMDMLI